MNATTATATPPPASLKRVVGRFDFTPRKPKPGDYAARGGLKDWPDEWVCRNCVWAKCSSVTLEPARPGQKKVWCAHKAQQWMWHNSDRMCFEEPGDMAEERERLGRTWHADNPPNT